MNTKESWGAFIERILDENGCPQCPIGIEKAKDE
jgi:hypothetical protein